MAPTLLEPGELFGSAIYSLTGEVLLWLDGNESERHSRRAKVSKYPGPRERTDNAEVEAGSFELSGWLTETPYNPQQNLGLNRTRSGLEILDSLLEQGGRYTVTGELRIYSPVQIESYEVVKRARQGRSVQVKISFSRALIAETLTAKVPASILAALVRDQARSPAVARVTPTPASAEQAASAQKSVFAGGLDGAAQALKSLGSLGTR